MPKNLPAIQPSSSFLLPPAVAELGTDGEAAFVEFFTAQISNNNTRLAYLRAVRRFCGWLEETGLQLEGLQPVHVAAYIEPMDKARDQGGAGLAPATVKQRELFASIDPATPAGVRDRALLGVMVYSFARIRRRLRWSWPTTSRSAAR